MKKQKISINLILKFNKKIKSEFYRNYFTDNINFLNKHKYLKDEKIFDNLITVICYFWFFRNQNTLTQKTDLKLIKKWKKNIPIDILKIIKDSIIYAINIKENNKEFIVGEKIFNNDIDFYVNNITKTIINNSINKNEDELIAIKTCIKSLYSFNFLDLYTFKLKLLEKNDDVNKYDELINLIQIQMNYLNLSYSVFKSFNSPNFNILFKTILTLKKSLL